MKTNEKRLRAAIKSLDLPHWDDAINTVAELTGRSSITVYGWLTHTRDIPDPLLELLELKLRINK